MSNNRLQRLPSNIGGLSSLTTINLANNRLHSLPSSFADLQNLRNLSLRGNRFTAVPESIFSLLALERLLLHHNSIEHCRLGFGKLTSLRILNLGYSQIASLPDLSNCLSLEKLYCNNLRKIGNESIPTWFETLPNLQEVYLYSIKFSPSVLAELMNLPSSRKVFLSKHKKSAKQQP